MTYEHNEAACLLSFAQGRDVVGAVFSILCITKYHRVSSEVQWDSNYSFLKYMRTTC